MVDITNIKKLAKEIENKFDLNYYEILNLLKDIIKELNLEVVEI